MGSDGDADCHRQRRRFHRDRAQAGRGVSLYALSAGRKTAAGSEDWYFSEPQDAPVKPAVASDRQTSYHAGAVGADPGPLAIGNFNQTMHGHGLDRQFRGEIRALQLFGSRVDGRGAFTRQRILKHAE